MYFEGKGAIRERTGGALTLGGLYFRFHCRCNSGEDRGGLQIAGPVHGSFSSALLA